MDGLKGVVPNTCGDKIETSVELFGEIQTKIVCEGCKTDNINKHNGIYCLIKDWSNKDLKTGKTGRKIKFIDVLKKSRK